MTRVCKLYRTSTLTVLFVTACFFAAQSQSRYGVNDTLTVPAIIYQGDTIPYRELSTVYIFLDLTPAQRKAHKEWTRLRNAVYVTYPYARKASIVFNDIKAHLDTIPDKEKRRAYVKSREKDLRSEFTKPLTDLSVYQGKVLMKLIARETGNTCYEIIKDYKGSFSAGFFQSIAWVFGSSLKQTYNAQGDDAVIEDIVREVRSMYGYY
ncbi:MAG: DUF4294 domain-containing protein [Chitinophagaceae bacterium]|nr:DUF4294 domain-containing protein [Chitinophagaceae bacterium]